ncbi:unnamed protein product [Allacma fusca]|uniref:Gustatory receptor n=1 Tax=Allacma fusca TaxID=39272 RepID=A0A8J2LCK4_9HEXA|nr:unnamed protein product [Allacma fusca]
MTVTSDNFPACKGFTFFLIFGKLFGIVPYHGLLRKDPRGLHFRSKSPATYFSVVIIALLGFFNAIALLDVWKSRGSSVFGIIGAASPCVYISCSMAVYVFFLKKYELFFKAVNGWRAVNTNLHFVINNAKASRDCYLTVFGYLLGFIIVGVLFDAKLVDLRTNENGMFKENLELNVSHLEIYYHRNFEFGAHLLPYHPVSAVLITTFLKICWVAHYYLDIFLIIIFRPLEFQLKTLMQTARDHRLIFDNGSYFHTTKDLERKWWGKIAEDYEALAELVEQISVLVSPLVFLAFLVDLFLISIEINFWLSANNNAGLLSTAYSVVCVMYFVARMMSISVKAGNIHSYGKIIGRLILQHCPITLLAYLTPRIERIMELDKISLNGLGFFTITKSFALRVINVLLTVEVFLLQGKIIL